MKKLSFLSVILMTFCLVFSTAASADTQKHKKKTHHASHVAKVDSKHAKASKKKHKKAA
jgi:hypothetical protein